MTEPTTATTPKPRINWDPSKGTTVQRARIVPVDLAWFEESLLPSPSGRGSRYVPFLSETLEAIEQVNATVWWADTGVLWYSEDRAPLGLCHTTQHWIFLSRDLFARHTWQQVMRTFLHELGHAHIGSVDENDAYAWAYAWAQEVMPATPLFDRMPAHLKPSIVRIDEERTKRRGQMAVAAFPTTAEPDRG
jgi:hypothetical protein